MDEDDQDTTHGYDLDAQVGFNLRRANQRHVAVFARHVGGLTPTQFAALARLYELGGLSQNRLGRLTAMDSATIKGVVERLRDKGMVTQKPDANDQRLRLVVLTAKGRSVFERARVQALAAREETVSPLSPEEIATFEALLAKLV
jgi:DNA-binding MarR family transcriptional regulator